jgi:hypothetical protein
MGVFALGGALGALAAYFFDPGNGGDRRHELRDRVAPFLRLAVQPGEQGSREVSAEAHGFSQKVQRPPEERVRDSASYAEQDVA